MTEQEAVLRREDFRDARASKRSLGRLRPKFVVLEQSILRLLPQQFNPMKRRRHHLVSKPNRRGGGYWSEIWLSMSSHQPPIYDGLMFQFGIWRDGVYSCGLWLQGGSDSSPSRNAAWSAISGDSVRFLRLLRSLGEGYYLELNEGEYSRSTDRIFEENIDEILDFLQGPNCFLNLSRRLSMREIIASKKRIPLLVATVFRDLYPLYSFLTALQTYRKHGKARPPNPVKILQSSIWAQNVVIAAERRKGRTVRDVSDRPVGYDLESKDRQGRTRLIEVKSRKIEGRLQLTPNEYAAAARFGPQYYIYVVRSQNNIQLIRNPILSCQIAKVPQFVWEIKDWPERAREYS